MSKPHLLIKKVKVPKFRQNAQSVSFLSRWFCASFTNRKKLRKPPCKVGMAVVKCVQAQMSRGATPKKNTYKPKEIKKWQTFTSIKSQSATLKSQKLTMQLCSPKPRTTATAQASLFTGDFTTTPTTAPLKSKSSGWGTPPHPHLKINI